MYTRRGILKGLLGAAATAVTGGCAYLHLGSGREIPEIAPDAHRIVLYAYNLDVPANLLNAKHLSLRFESGPMRRAFSLHGLATDRETLVERPMGFAAHDDIMVHGYVCDPEETEESIDRFSRPLAVLHETKDAGAFCALYIRALQASIAINRERIPYDMLSTNCNAAANTIASACGLMLPSHVPGITPGKEVTLLPARHAPPAPDFSNSYTGLCTARDALAGEMWALKESRKKEELRPVLFPQSLFGEELEALKEMGMLYDEKLPVHALFVDYRLAYARYDALALGAQRVSYPMVESCKAELFSKRAQIQSEFGIEMMLPYSMRRPATPRRGQDSVFVI